MSKTMEELQEMMPESTARVKVDLFTSEHPDDGQVIKMRLIQEPELIGARKFGFNLYPNSDDTVSASAVETAMRSLKKRYDQLHKPDPLRDWIFDLERQIMNGRAVHRRVRDIFALSYRMSEAVEIRRNPKTTEAEFAMVMQRLVDGARLSFGLDTFCPCCEDVVLKGLMVEEKRCSKCVGRGWTRKG